MKRTLLLLFTCLMLLSWPQCAMAELQTAVFAGGCFWCMAVSYTHLRAHETPEHLVCRLLLEKKK